MKSQQNIDASLLELEEKVGQLARQDEDIVKQSLNSHHDHNLHIENLLEFHTGYTCDPDMYVEINFAMPLVSISFARIEPYRDTPEVHMTSQDKEDFDDKCAGKGPNLNGMSNLEASTIPISSTNTIASTTTLDVIKQLVHNHTLLFALKNLMVLRMIIYLNFQEDLNYPILQTLLLVIHVLVHSFVKHVLRLTNAYRLTI